MNYNHILNKINVFNTPIKVDEDWYLLSKRNFLGSKIKLFKIEFHQTNDGIAPSWTFLGDVTSDYHIIYSNITG